MKNKVLFAFILVAGLLIGSAVNALGDEKEGTMKVIQEEKTIYNGEYIDEGEVVLYSRTDGVILEKLRLGVHEEDENNKYDRMVFDFSGDVLPGASIKSYEHPQTLVLEFGGIRGYGDVSRSKGFRDIIWDDIKFPNYIKNIYPIITLDDCTIRVGVEFYEDVDFKVFYMKNPSKIVIDCRASEEKEEEKDGLFSLRTETFEHSEPIGHIEEVLEYEYHGKHVRLMEMYDRRVYVEEGVYEHYKEALRKKLELEKKMKEDNNKCKFYIVELKRYKR